MEGIKWCMIVMSFIMMLVKIVEIIETLITKDCHEFDASNKIYYRIESSIIFFVSLGMYITSKYLIEIKEFILKAYKRTTDLTLSDF